ncbi:MAG: hypothetical protein KDE53_31535, partial [Caldilineaceae bacterium]|nr:hypothetical protein [Caldilineaceae bacterium]
MTVQLLVPGREIPTRAEADSELKKFDLEVETTHAVQIEAAARGRGAEIELKGLEESDLLELQYEDGVCEWLRADELRSRLGQEQRGETTAIRVPSTLPMAATRGGVDLALTGIRVLKTQFGDVLGKLLKDAGIDIGAKLLAKGGAKLIVQHFESKLNPAGLYHLRPDGRCGDLVDAGTSLPTSDDPYLVLLHGTFSTTQGSFGTLFHSPDQPIPTP